MYKLPESNDAETQYRLALMYYEGDRVSQDYEEAEKWYIKSASQGHIKAQYDLGWFYRQGIIDIEAENHDIIDKIIKNESEALKWFTLAGNQGHVDAQNIVANIYFHGYGVKKDKKEARRWWNKTVENNDPEAQYHLGCRYTTGNGGGMVRNYKEANRLYILSAKQGFARGFHALGNSFSYGFGLDKDYILGYMFYRLSILLGDMRSTHEIKNVMVNMNESEISMAEDKVKDCLALGYEDYIDGIPALSK